MNEDEIKKLMEGIAEKNSKAMREAIDAAKAGLISKTDLESLGIKDGVIKNIVEGQTEIKGILDTQGTEMRKLSNGNGSKGKSIDDLVIEKADAIRAISQGAPNVKLTVNKTLVQRSLLSGSTLGMRLPDVGYLGYPNTVMSSLFRHAQVSPGSNGVIRYFDQAAVTRGAAWVAEGAQKPESAISWIERSLLIQKIADSIPVTKEAWTDIPFIQSELKRLLEVNLSLKIDDSLYDGDGVAPNITGVYTYAPAFVTTPYADSVESANLFDLIAVVAADIQSGMGSKYNPNTVLINPINALGLAVAKSPQGNYLLPPFGNVSNVLGMRIVASGQVTPNTMVVGDFSYGTIYDLEDFTIEMGWINDQFIKNCFTILAEQRLALLIRNGDLGAFRKVTNITTALADLETP